MGSKIASVIGHSCAYNYRVDDKLILKKFRWLGNHSRLLEAVSHSCDKRHPHYTPRRDSGAESAVGYTEELVRAILAATVDLAAYREPSRFAVAEAQSGLLPGRREGHHQVGVRYQHGSGARGYSKEQGSFHSQ